MSYLTHLPYARALRDLDLQLLGDNEIHESLLTKWRSGFRQYFRKDGNWVHLLGIMTTWFLLDVSFHGLGML